MIQHTSNMYTRSSFLDSRLAKKHLRIRFADIRDAVVPNDGVPFAILSVYERTCLFGKDQHRGSKKRQQEAHEKQMQVSCNQYAHC